MEPTLTAERGVSEPDALWPIVLQAFGAAVILGAELQLRWATSDFFGKVMGIAILIGLVVSPTIEVFRRRSGKNVRFSRLAAGGYAWVWITAVVLDRHFR
jgi:hypothetical protein